MSIANINSAGALQEWIDYVVAANREKVSELGPELIAEKLVMEWDPQSGTLSRLLPDFLQLGSDSLVGTDGAMIASRLPATDVLEYAQEIPLESPDEREVAVAIMAANVRERLEETEAITVMLSGSDLRELIRHQYLVYETMYGSVLFYLNGSFRTERENRERSWGVDTHEFETIATCNVAMDSLRRLLNGGEAQQWHSTTAVNLPLHVGSEADSYKIGS
ncbi:hypothetical protein [Halosegnis longus]|uniref:hypothetical protein n=1 Tax=Halosegnis longus TaxID=2216012 RepID=UPI00129E41F5|nr:hypothetical protein [Halosegnis longus]